MKVAILFVLFFATVLCRPAKKVSLSSSESSEEVVRRPAPPALRKQAAVVPQTRAAPVQNVVAPAAANSDESKESSDEDEVAAEAPVEVKSDSTVLNAASVKSQDSEKDDDDDDDETEETEEEEDESSSESDESSTIAPVTVTPVIVTDEPVAETTVEPIIPTIITDTDAARGDNLGGHPSDYKSIDYVEDKSYHKIPVPYKSYEFVGTGKKMAYDKTNGNEVEKSLKVYKAIQVHSDFEEDTSTPEMENQGPDASSGTTQDQDHSPRQASLPEEDGATEASTTNESESSSNPEEEEVEESNSNSDSSSQEAEKNQSSESDESDSNESDSDKDGSGPDNTTEMPLVISAK
ncbi:osteopontin [Mastacembelus armatus]|uniref:Secreted phosphoprotein 1 n=1 Tax=Mastacembelus armatus TaxID=205130 RepID=A0A3Q3N239_9TELE|nr:nucleolin-like [Mastacembelus armatus]